MLPIATPFPQVGSEAYLIGSAQQARIIGRDRGDICLISVVDPRSPNAQKKASGNRRVPLGELRSTREEAALVSVPRQHHRAGRISQRAAL